MKQPALFVLALMIASPLAAQNQDLGQPVPEGGEVETIDEGEEGLVPGDQRRRALRAGLARAGVAPGRLEVAALDLQRLPTNTRRAFDTQICCSKR